MLEMTIDLKNYDREETVFHRDAARAVICRGNAFLLIHSRHGDYKFPGGGVNPGENLVEAMIREVREETGYLVLPGTIRPLGKVCERRKGMDADVMEMDSHYFACEVEIRAGERQLDTYEAEYGYEVVWMPLAEAIERNRAGADEGKTPWIVRDSQVMDWLLERTKAG